MLVYGNGFYFKVHFYAWKQEINGDVMGDVKVEKYVSDSHIHVKYPNEIILKKKIFGNF